MSRPWLWTSLGTVAVCLFISCGSPSDRRELELWRDLQSVEMAASHLNELFENANDPITKGDVAEFESRMRALEDAQVKLDESIKSSEAHNELAGNCGPCKCREAAYKRYTACVKECTGTNFVPLVAIDDGGSNPTKVCVQRCNDILDKDLKRCRKILWELK
jgi:hypothetical protein